MSSALIGYTGFVGTTLLKQARFDSLFRSTNISDISGKSFDLIVCAGAPAQKWLANRDPETDRRGIERLMKCIDGVQCKTFVLVSTVDVFAQPDGVNEDSVVDESELQPYGLNRRMLERFVEERFPQHLIVRLPGLVGPGLRKNVIFDFLNKNNLQAIDSRGVFQFYPMVNLWHDLQTALAASLKLVHLTAEPVSVEKIAALGFGSEFAQRLEKPVVAYDFQSKHAALFGGRGNYQYSLRETILAVRAYAQSEHSGSADEGGASS